MGPVELTDSEFDGFVACDVELNGGTSFGCRICISTQLATRLTVSDLHTTVPG
jgi:hypothetical protein